MSQERWVNGVRWGSYYAPPALEQIEAFETQAGIKLPKAMVQLYQVGDGPFVKQAGDEVAAYHFEDQHIRARGHIGSALYFYTVEQHGISGSLQWSTETIARKLGSEFVAVATDGGAEDLLLRYDAEEPSVWHYAPTYRLDDITLVRVAASFEAFLRRIEYFPCPVASRRG
jgi:SMI1/KNR4 family protein SUKH-1